MLETVKKLFSRNFEITDDILVLREKEYIGRRLREIKDGKDFKTVEEYILLPLQISAFEAFKKADAGDAIQIIETQMMSKIIDMIRKEMEIKINSGKLAEQRLKTLTAEADEEEE